MSKLSSRDYPGLYEDLGLDGIDFNNLGCIMLTVDPFPVTYLVDNGEQELFDGDAEAHTGGAPAEQEAHITLLYGLLKSGKEWMDQVNQVLDGWELPDDLIISGVTAFPGDGYTCIVGLIAESDELIEGNARLRMLPHVDTFPYYTAHVTLAYVVDGPSTVPWATSVADKWVQTLNVQLAGKHLNPRGLDYGD